MGKMVSAILMVFAVELAVVLFLSCSGGSCPSNTSLFLFLLNPQDWDLSTFISAISQDVLLIAGSTAVIVGTLFWRNEFIVYAGFTAVFFSFGQVFYQLWQNINSQTALFGGAANYIAIFVLGAVMIYFIMAVLDYARGRD